MHNEITMKIMSPIIWNGHNQRLTITGSLRAWNLKVVDSSPSNVTRGTSAEVDILAEPNLWNGSAGPANTSGNKTKKVRWYIIEHVDN